MENGKWYQQPLQKWHKVFLGVFWGLFVAGIATAIIIVVFIISGTIGYMPPLEDLQNPKSIYASEIISSDGEVIGRYYKENRVGVQYNEISPYMIDALVATEDARFYSHTGVDVKSMFRAILKLGRAGGGSTITQQLAKQLWSPSVHNIFERAMQKPIEWVIATKLERLYSKEEIMTMYLNKFDFLYNAVGIQSASQVYFSKTPADLNLQEAATLVGMCKNPSLYNPKRDSTRAVNRRNTVLSQMEKYGKIDKATRDSVSQLPLTLNFRSVDHKQGVAPYFREYLRVTLTAKEPKESNYNKWNKLQYKLDTIQWNHNPLYGFCEKNRKPDGSKYDIYHDGLKIYTTIDTRMQRYAEEAVNEQMQALQNKFDKEMKKKKYAPYSDLSYKQRRNGAVFNMESTMKKAIERTERYRLMREKGCSYDSIFRSFQVPQEMRVFSYNGPIDTIMTPYDSIRWQKSFLRCGFMSMDPHTGQVKAYVGGPNFTYFQYDMVTKGRRQIGSTVKPFLFTLAMVEGMWPCDTMTYDSVTLYDANGKAFTPDDTHADHQYKVVDFTWGLKESSNWMSAYLMSLFTPEKLAGLMHSFGINGQIDPYVSLCLGPCEVSVEEMVGAYTTFANKGIHTTPLYVTRIEDKNGNVIASFSPQTKEIISELTVYKMVHMLRAVCTGGTGNRMRRTDGIKPDADGFVKTFGLTAQMGGKTGTSNENADGWFMCFTPSLVSGVWVGGEDYQIHFDNMTWGQGAASALPVCGRYLQKVFADPDLGYSQDEQFDIPEWFDPSEGCK